MPSHLAHQTKEQVLVGLISQDQAMSNRTHQSINGVIRQVNKHKHTEKVRQAKVPRNFSTKSAVTEFDSKLH